MGTQIRRGHCPPEPAIELGAHRWTVSTTCGRAREEMGRYAEAIALHEKREKVSSRRRVSARLLNLCADGVD